MASAQTLVAGRYRLHQQLGGGGMGLVWRARDEILGRDVAIKEVIPPAGLSDLDRAELRFRTLREARTAARLNHPNVVKIYDVVHTEEWPWIVMEYVPSRSLHEVITADGPLGPVQAAEIGLSVLAALTAAHTAGVLHRDVKPGNVLVGDDGRVVLTDFGLATFDGTDSAVTLPGLVLGSAQYVAPERARDGTSTPESDLWSLGATLYAAVEGRSPYARSSTMATLTALATALPDPPQRAGALKPVLIGLLRHNPRFRMTPAVAQRGLLRVINQNGPGRRRIPGQRRGREATGGTPAPALGLEVDQTAQIPAGPARSSVGAVLRSASGAFGRSPAAAFVRRPPWWAWRPAHRRGEWLGVSALVVALVVALGALLVYRYGGSPTAVPKPPAAARPSAPPAAPVLGTTACGSTARPTPLRSIPPQPGWDGLLPGFVWYLDPSGFRISVPAGWSETPGSGGVCFREPGNTRVLAVQPFSPDGDPVAHWHRQEAELLATGRPRDYLDLGIAPVPYYFAGAAQWEYTYLDAAGTPQHGLSRCFIVSASLAYTVVWRTRQFDWQPNQDPYRAIIASFAPAA
ncbi:MAG TPA: serine/threonine-protein kinase [Rugosimonospora sp.]